MHYDAFVDAGYLREEIARATGAAGRRVPPSQLRVDGRRLWRTLRDLELPGHPEATLGTARFYDGVPPAKHLDEDQQAHLDRYLTSLSRHLEVRTSRLGVTRLRVKGPTRTAVFQVAQKLGLDGDELCTLLQENLDAQHRGSPQYEQKGVDTLIATDLVLGATDHWFGAAVLLSGDRDLLAAVQTAQRKKRPVWLLVPGGAVGAGGRERSVARDLEREVAGVITLEVEDLLRLRYQRRRG